jgi:ABC-type lipoprotein export system ATPase subunit
VEPVPLLEIQGLRHTFAAPAGGRRLVLDVPSLTLAPGEQVALRGPSGCGKTTLLHCIAGLLRPDAGSIRLAGVDVAALPEPARDRHRARTLGYVFQTFNLLQGHTCLENVRLGLAFAGGAVPDGRAEQLLDRMGLAAHLHHFPRQLSTGQQQRVAIARALANRPQLVLADEPTGNLDSRAGRAALRLIRETCREAGAALLLVSHDAAVLDAFDDVRDFTALNRAAAALDTDDLPEPAA